MGDAKAVTENWPEGDTKADIDVLCEAEVDTLARPVTVVDVDTDAPADQAPDGDARALGVSKLGKAELEALGDDDAASDASAECDAVGDGFTERDALGEGKTSPTSRTVGPPQYGGGGGCPGGSRSSAYATATVRGKAVICCALSTMLVSSAEGLPRFGDRDRVTVFSSCPCDSLPAASARLLPPATGDAYAGSGAAKPELAPRADSSARARRSELGKHDAVLHGSSRLTT